MSNSKLSFSIAVKLLTDNFKKGTASLKSSLRSMQMQFMSFAAALGAGTIGLTNFLSKMVETAKETSRVNIALKNVSKSTEEYAGHQEYLVGLSKKYGVQINSLTGGFAKFKAAADISNMALSDQYKIFESVSRAAVAFGLSAEDQKGVFLALSQMMSKNKVMAEELRLQMAERMPVAIQAMAKAAGVSVEELDKLMKQGKLYASDVLPRFAEVLNSMIPNVDTDNLTASLSRLSNAFVNLVKDWGIEEKFKSIVDVATRLLDVLASNAKAIFTGLRLVITSALANTVYRAVNSIGGSYDKFVANAVKAQERLQARQEATARAEIAVKEAAAERDKALEAEKALAVDASEAKKTAARKRAANAEAALSKKTTLLVKAQEQEKAAAAKVSARQIAAAAAAGAKGWTRAVNIIKFNIARLVASMKAAAAATIWTAAITAVMELVRWLVKAVKETNRIKNIVSDTRAEFQKPIDLESVDKLYRIRDIVFSRESTDEAREGALRQINELLGTSYRLEDAAKGKASELNKEIERRVQLLQVEEDIRRKSEVLQKRKEELKSLQGSDAYKKELDDYRAEVARRLAIWKDPRLIGTVPVRSDSKLAEEQRLKQAISEAEFALQNAMRVQSELSNRPDTIEYDSSYTSGGDGSGGKKTELDKQEQKYAESLRDIQKRLDTNIITQDEYDEALRELIEKSYVEAYASGDRGVLESEYYKKLEEAFKKLPRGESYEAERQRTAILKEYNDSVKRRKAELEAGVITEKEYREALFDLTRETRKNLASNMAGADDFDRAYFSGLGDIVRGLAPVPEVKTRDTSRDYRKSDADILEESFAIAEKNRDMFLRLAEETGGMFAKELADAMSNVETLEEALRIAEAKEAVKELTKEFRSGIYTGAKGIVGDVDNIVSAFERVGEVMSDIDASGWERVMAIWEAMTSISDAFLQTIEIIERLTKVKELLTKAEAAEGTISDITTAKKVANDAITTASDSSATEIEIQNARRKVAAKQGEAASEAGASASKLGPLGWLAIGAAIASAIAAFASIPRFEKGGIVGGNSPEGDKILARLNSGEMVLNKDQQGTLYGLLNNRKQQVSVSGEFRVRGRDLMAVIDSNNRFIERTK